MSKVQADVNVIELPRQRRAMISEEPRYHYMYFLGNMYFLAMPYIHYLMSAWLQDGWLLNKVFVTPQPLRKEKAATVWRPPLPNIMYDYSPCMVQGRGRKQIEVIHTFWQGGFNMDGMQICHSTALFRQIKSAVLPASNQTPQDVNWQTPQDVNWWHDFFQSWEDQLTPTDMLNLSWETSGGGWTTLDLRTQQACEARTTRGHLCSIQIDDCRYHRCRALTTKRRPCRNLAKSCPHHGDNHA